MSRMAEQAQDQQERENELELFNSDWYITNIKRGTGTMNKYIYAELRNSKGELMISATLDNIVKSVGEYRIKPTPKPDYILYRNASLTTDDDFVSWGFNPPNIKLVFDGETRELKSAEVIK